MPTRFANRVCPFLSVLCIFALLPAQDATSVRGHLPGGCGNFAQVRGLGPALAWLATSPWFEDGLLASLGWPADPLRQGLSHFGDLLPPDMAIGFTQESCAAIATMLEVATLADVLAVYRAHGVDDAEAKAVRARLLQRLQQPLTFGVVATARAADAGTAAAWIDTQLLAMVSGHLVPCESRPDGDDAVIDISLWQFGQFYDLAERLRQLGIEPDAQLRLHQRCGVRGRDAVWQWTVDRSNRSQRLADGGPAAAAPEAFTIDARFDLAAAQAAADAALGAVDRMPDALVGELGSQAARWLVRCLELPQQGKLLLDGNGQWRWSGRSMDDSEEPALPPSLQALCGAGLAGYLVGGDPLDVALSDAEADWSDLARAEETLLGNRMPLQPVRALIQLEPLLEWLHADDSSLLLPGWALLLGEPVAVGRVALRGADERVVESATPVRLRLPAVAVVGRPRSVDDGWTFAATTTAKLLQSLHRPPAELVELDLGLGVPTRVLPWTALFGDHGVGVEVEGEARLHWCQRGDLLVCSSSMALTRDLLAASPPGQASTSLLGCGSLPAKAVAAQVAALFSLPEEIAHGSLDSVAKALGCRVDGGDENGRLRSAWVGSLGRAAGFEMRRERADGVVQTTANWPCLGR